jgi:hypothetical protein
VTVRYSNRAFSGRVTRIDNGIAFWVFGTRGG